MASTSRQGVHIVGLGNIGVLVAIALAKLPQPPTLTLLLSGEDAYHEFNRCSRVLSCQALNGKFENCDNFEVEYLQNDIWVPESLGTGTSTTPLPPIENLVVAVKALQTSGVLQTLKHRLTRTSNILFLQNGMGMKEELNETVFPVAEERPQYITGVTSHGVNRLKRFSVIHAGGGSTILGMPLSGHEAIPLLGMLKETRALCAKVVSEQQLERAQLEKLAVNAVINPLTAVFECRNGDLLDDRIAGQLVRNLIAETSAIIRSLPELYGTEPELTFSEAILCSLVADVACKTARNKSSMLQDMLNRRTTEIDYINGYLVRRAKEVGIASPLNNVMTQLVKGKHMLATANLPLPNC